VLRVKYNVRYGDGMTTIAAPTSRRWRRWPLLLVSFPLSGLVASLLLGPVASVSDALLGGAFVGLVIGFSGAFALGTPWRRWVPATVVGLALGTLASFAVPLVGPLVQGAILGLAQGFARPAVRPLIWVPLTAAVWGIAWVISWFVAVSDEPGFVTFGASGALFYTLSMLAATLIAKRVAR
jgi:hypothetical protein